MDNKKFQFEIKATAKVKQFRFELFIPWFERTFRAIFQFYRTPNVWTSGMSSRCMDGRHVLFFDFDHVDLKQIEDEIKYLQEFFSLSHAYIFVLDRDKSYHVVIPDKFPLIKAYNILSESNVEWAYLNSVRFTRGREWVLRIDKKAKRKMPVFLKIIKSTNNTQQVSKAHVSFMQKYYGADKINYKNSDNITVIPLVNYNTGNRVD